MIVEFANLQLEGYYVDELHCAAADHMDDAEMLAMTPGLHVQPPKPMGLDAYSVLVQIEGGQHKRDPSRFRVVLRIASDEKDEDRPPYDFDLTLVGYFRSQVKPTPAIEPYLLRNAAMILYSSARELLASVTGRGPFPALVLPTLTFDPDLKPPSKLRRGGSQSSPNTSKPGRKLITASSKTSSTSRKASKKK